MAYSSPPAIREPRGYQREPHLRVLIGYAVAAAFLAVFALVVNFGLGRHPSSASQVTGNDAHVARTTAVAAPSDATATATAARR
ncbi:hypothetical protein [Actinospica sp.]|jgi:hypothetical protein|uniref:hypothetical protein n=1 Tax=Actinospica sp. TaxID=1872142 RepID=UPI002C59B4E4|nr:hypothetical protein [Actinospica sp.]HWG25912.1 hypothetical protein [Actinospica sp.]